MYKKYKFKILIFYLLFNIGVVNMQAEEDDYIKPYLNKYGYDYDSKSIRGWIRVFKSDEKLKEYGIVIQKKERKKVLFYLKKDYDKYRKKYRRGIE